MLYIVATPIGNLEDITLRAVRVLREVDFIAAEDTRHSKKLLQHLGIATPMISLHEHNEQQRSQQLLHLLQQGKRIALISDAGTPLISDPGYRLVAKIQAAGIKIVPVPGACAAITALCASGLPTDKFIFEGFLSAKSSARREQLKQLLHETRTLIFYESPHRIVASTTDMIAIFGFDRRAVLAKELTKTFETIQAGSLEELQTWLLADANHQRGEFVVLVQGAAEQATTTEKNNISATQILSELLSELPLKQAVVLTAKITGEKKNKLYDLAVKMQA